MNRNNRGFSLIELVVVIAIMSVLTAVVSVSLLPKIERSRESTDLANVRAAFLEVHAAAVHDDKDAVYGKDQVMYRVDDEGKGYYMAEVKLVQAGDGWSTSTESLNVAGVGYASERWQNEPEAKGVCQVICIDNVMYLNWGGDSIDYKRTDSVAKYVLNQMQKELKNYIDSKSTDYSTLFAKNTDDSVTKSMELPNGQTVKVQIFSRNYNSFKDVQTRLTEANTATLIYNRDTKQVSTIIYYDGKDYTAWTITDGDNWTVNEYTKNK